MKVRVKTEFKDKYTGSLYKTGDEFDMSIERINEVLKVGSFIELVAEQTECEQEEVEQTETSEQSLTSGDQAEETQKQTGRRKRSK